jgi:hypothetical protein
MPSCLRDGAQEDTLNFQIVSPADGTSLPVHPRDFGTFPRQLCDHSTNCRSAFDEIMAPNWSPTMRHLADQVCVGWAAVHFGRNPASFRGHQTSKVAKIDLHQVRSGIVCTVSNMSPVGALPLVGNAYSLPSKSACGWMALVGAAPRDGVCSTGLACNSNRSLRRDAGAMCSFGHGGAIGQVAVIAMQPPSQSRHARGRRVGFA